MYNYKRLYSQCVLNEGWNPEDLNANLPPLNIVSDRCDVSWIRSLGYRCGVHERMPCFFSLLCLGQSFFGITASTLRFHVPFPFHIDSSCGVQNNCSGLHERDSVSGVLPFHDLFSRFPRTLIHFQVGKSDSFTGAYLLHAIWCSIWNTYSIYTQGGQAKLYKIIISVKAIINQKY